MIQIGNDKIKDIYVGSDKIKEVYYGSEKVWGIQSAVQDGYWVHKDTAVKTYFGADADFINNGVMGRPSWIANAKEISLCTGITGFAVETITIVDPEWGDYSFEVTSSFIESYDSYGIPFNTILEILRFGEASVQEVPPNLVISYRDENGEAFSSLTEVYLNDAVTTLAQVTFSGCTSLTTIDMPSVTAIGQGAFSGCTSLTTINVPSVTTIGYSAFYDCNSLTTINLPSIITLGDTVFDTMSGLQTADIGMSIVDIDRNPFYKTPALSTLYIRATTPPTGDWRNSVVSSPIPAGLKIKVPSASVAAYKAVASLTIRNLIEAI